MCCDEISVGSRVPRDRTVGRGVPDAPVGSRVPRDRAQASLEVNFLVGKVKYSVRRVRKNK